MRQFRRRRGRTSPDVFVQMAYTSIKDCLIRDWRSLCIRSSLVVIPFVTNLPAFFRLSETCKTFDSSGQIGYNPLRSEFDRIAQELLIGA